MPRRTAATDGSSSPSWTGSSARPWASRSWRANTRWTRSAPGRVAKRSSSRRCAGGGDRVGGGGEAGVVAGDQLVHQPPGVGQRVVPEHGDRSGLGALGYRAVEVQRAATPVVHPRVGGPGEVVGELRERGVGELRARDVEKLRGRGVGEPGGDGFPISEVDEIGTELDGWALPEALAPAVAARPAPHRVLGPAGRKWGAAGQRMRPTR